MKFLPLICALSLGIAAPALAQESEPYPAKPIRIVVPWTPGQATDIAARAASAKLAEALGQSFIVENRAGAGGTIGASSVVKAAPDGYTLLAGSSGSVTVNPILQKANYAPTDLEPAGMIAKIPYVLVTAADFPAKNAEELIALIKSNPGKYAFASSGAGSIGHLTAEVFLSKIGADVQHVPYKGSAGALTDVLSGRVAFMWDSVASVSGQVASGAARAYAVSSGERTATMPDVPSLSEASNIKDFDMVAWVGLMAPKGTPPERLDRINDVLLEVLKTPEVSKQFLTLGIDPFPIPRAQAVKVIAAEVERLGAVVAENQVAAQ